MEKSKYLIDQESQDKLANIEKIKKEMRWRPKINIKKGVKLLMEHIDTFSDAPLS